MLIGDVFDVDEYVDIEEMIMKEGRMTIEEIEKALNENEEDIQPIQQEWKDRIIYLLSRIKELERQLESCTKIREA